MGKKLMGILENANPGLRFKLQKYAGTNKRETHIKANGKPIINCKADSYEDQSPLWDNGLVAEFHIDKTEVLTKFNAPSASASSGSTQWSL